ncbi:hypothetical protein KR52_03365 [Synechococcus sp. KORDI-52]|nr:hypothetical protein KR52_03365 [Synechococcus sp. KORDI-52]
MNAESLLLLQALDGAVDQAFADVEPCSFAPGSCLVREGESVDGLLLISRRVWFRLDGLIWWIPRGRCWVHPV